MTAPRRRPRRPILLDLFCGAGGAAMGYNLAGFHVIGVDISPQPNYPFEFIQADAMALSLRSITLHSSLGSALGSRSIDAVHASPPCQAYSPLNAYNHKDYPDLIAEVRQRLRAFGRPYVIENVVQAPLNSPVVLCGGMFGLRVYRHRGFETSFPTVAPAHPRHLVRCARNGYEPTEGQPNMTITGGKHSQNWRRAANRAMGVPWMRTIPEVCESIPPAYTEFVGRSLMAHLGGDLAATVSGLAATAVVGDVTA